MAAEGEMEELREQLFNVEVTDDNLLKRLIQISRNSDLSLAQVADEWTSFSSSKSLQLDLDNIETFSLSLSSRQQKPQSSFQTTPTSTQRYTKDNLHLLFNSGSREKYANDDDQEDVMSGYIDKIGGEGLAKVGGVKREAPPLPVISPAPKNRYSSGRTPVRNEEPSVSQMLDTPSTNYRSTQASGKVIASFSQGAEKWVESKGIENIRYRDTAGVRLKRLMYQPPLQKRSVMAERIISLGNKICQQIGIKDIRSTSLLTGPTTEPSVFIGRVVCDSEGRLNAHSCLLEGVWSYEADILKARLVRVVLDLSKSSEQLSICLFPGQIIAVEGTLNHSGVLAPTKIHDSGALPPLPSVRNSLVHKVNVGTGGLSCISAAGPFTFMESLNLSPLLDLLQVVETQKPKLLILVGPFIEHSHPSVKNGKQFEDYDSFETYFVTQILQPIHATCLKSNTRVLILPAQNDVCHSLMVYPQQPYLLSDAISNEVRIIHEPFDHTHHEV